MYVCRNSSNALARITRGPYEDLEAVGIGRPKRAADLALVHAALEGYCVAQMPTSVDGPGNTGGELAQRTFRVALALHIARRSTPLGVTRG